jgi:DNA-binding XRE family transcriptional regulator
MSDVNAEIDFRLSDNQITTKKTLAAAIGLATETLMLIEPDRGALTNEEASILSAAIANELKL